MKRFLKWAVRILLVLLAIPVLGAATYWGYSEWQKRLDLTYSTMGGWEWLDKSAGIQTRTSEDGEVQLRKVDRGRRQIIVASLTESGLEAGSLWPTDCDGGTVIETSSKYDDGKPMFLSCAIGSSGQTYLAIFVRWSTDENGVPDTDVIWNEDLDGFSVYANFGTWDFTAARQALTLKRAKPAVPPTETDQEPAPQEGEATDRE